MPDLSALTELLKKIKVPNGTVAASEALPNVGIDAKPEIAAPNPTDFMNKGIPYANLKKEAATREQFAGADFSGREYSDPITQAEYQKVYGDPAAQGKTVSQLEHPGWKGRLAAAGKGFVLGTAKGGLGAGIGAASGSAADPTGAAEKQFEYGEGADLEQRVGRENEQRSAQAKLAEIFARIQGHGTDQQYKQAQIGNMAEDNRRQAQEAAAKAAKPIIVGGVAVDPQTRKPVYDSRIKVDTSGQYVRQWNPETSQFEISRDEAGAPIESTKYLAIKQSDVNNQRNNQTSTNNNIRTTTTSANNNAASNQVKKYGIDRGTQEKYDRTAQTEAGRNARQNAKTTGQQVGGSSGKMFPAAKLAEYAKAHNATEAEAKKYLEANGYAIK